MAYTRLMWVGLLANAYVRPMCYPLCDSRASCAYSERSCPKLQANNDCRVRTSIHSKVFPETHHAPPRISGFSPACHPLNKCSMTQQSFAYKRLTHPNSVTYLTCVLNDQLSAVVPAVVECRTQAECTSSTLKQCSVEYILRIP